MDPATLAHDGLGAVRDWLAIAQIVGTVVIGLLVWAFSSGRWTKTQEGSRENAADGITKLEKRVDAEHAAEHAERKRLVRELGTLQREHAVLAGRVNRCETDIQELRRRVYNGGGPITT